jgi:hypothetical protein
MMFYAFHILNTRNMCVWGRYGAIDYDGFGRWKDVCTYTMPVYVSISDVESDFGKKSKQHVTRKFPLSVSCYTYFLLWKFKNRGWRREIVGNAILSSRTKFVSDGFAISVATGKNTYKHVSNNLL